MPEGARWGGTPTGAVTVVGIGAAGCRMARAVRDLQREVELGATVEYVAIDSDEEDLSSSVPGDVRGVSLDYADTIGTDAERFDYLSGDLEVPSRGTRGERRLGRYAVDNSASFDRTYTVLADAIRGVHESATANGADGAHQVWLLYALGGGTGSGAFPLVAAMVDDVITGLPGRFAVGALGSMPRLDMLEEQMTMPSGHARFYVNAYAALRELRVLLDDGGGTSYPLSIPVASAEASEQMAANALTLSGPPVDVYGLLGVAETSTDHYRTVVNDVAAGVVLGLADRPVDTGDGLDRFRDPPGQPDGRRLFSVDGSRVRLPVDDLRQYAELQRKVDEMAEKRDRLAAQRSNRRASVTFLQRVLAAEPAEGVGTDLPDVAAAADDLPEPRELTVRDVEALIRTVAGDLSTPEEVGAGTVATYLVTKLLRGQLSEATSGHPFQEEVAAVHDRYQDALEDRTTPANPLTYWEDVMAPFMRERIDALEQELEETPFYLVPRRNRIESRLEALQAERERLDSLAREYERLEEVDSWVDDRFMSSLYDLRERRNELEERVDGTEQRRRELADELDGVRHRSEALRDRLTSGDVSPYVVEPAVADVERAAETVESGDVDGLAALVERDILTEEALREAVESAQAALEEPVQDSRTDPESDSLLVCAVEGNRDLLAPAGRFRTVLEQDSTDPFTVRLTALFAPVYLDATSEFGTVHEWFSDPERDISTQFGTGVTDTVVTRSFAYPGLLGDDRIG